MGPCQVCSCVLFHSFSNGSRITAQAPGASINIEKTNASKDSLASKDNLL